MRRPAFRPGPAAALTLTASLWALAAQAELPDGITHFTLPNGLETVVIEDERAPVVVQMLWYKIGAADEQPGKSGIAHYLEHLMFKGTDTLRPGELSQTVTANGGRDNAFTSWDFTTYFQRIASDRLPLVMEMEADRMANLRISDDDWQAERAVVLAERAQRVDSDPAALFAEEMGAVLYDNHPYGRPIIGWRDEIEALTRDDALAWYDTHYAPDRAVLVIAGDVSAEDARRLAQEHYGDIPASARPEPSARPQESPRRSTRHLTMIDARASQPMMRRSILAPERDPGQQREAAALTVLADLLGGSSQTSVLGRALVQSGQALWVSASYDGLSRDRTEFRLSMIPADTVSPDQASEALNAALERFLAEGPGPDDLERVKTRVRANQVYAQDSTQRRAYDYGQGLAVGLTPQDVADWPEILASVTAEEVMEAAQLVLQDRGAVIGWLLPDDQDDAVQDASRPAATAEAERAGPDAPPAPPPASSPESSEVIQ